MQRHRNLINHRRLHNRPSKVFDLHALLEELAALQPQDDNEHRDHEEDERHEDEDDELVDVHFVAVAEVQRYEQEKQEQCMTKDFDAYRNVAKFTAASSAFDGIDDVIDGQIIARIHRVDDGNVLTVQLHRVRGRRRAFRC